MAEEHTFGVANLIGARDGNPRVEISLDNVRIQVSPNQARAFAFQIIASAAYTEADAAIVDFAHTLVKDEMVESDMERALIRELLEGFRAVQRREADLHPAREGERYDGERPPR